MATQQIVPLLALQTGLGDGSLGEEGLDLGILVLQNLPRVGRLLRRLHSRHLLIVLVIHLPKSKLIISHVQHACERPPSVSLNYGTLLPARQCSL